MVIRNTMKRRKLEYLYENEIWAIECDHDKKNYEEFESSIREVYNSIAPAAANKTIIIILNIITF